MMLTIKNVVFVAVVISSLLIQTLALKAGVDFNCPKGFYCASKKSGGEWCTGHNECLSGECVIGVGCAMTTNDLNGSEGCNFDSDCDVGFKCHNNGVCYVPDVPDSVESTPQQQDQQQQLKKKELGAGAIAGIAIAAVLVVVVIVAGWTALCASTSKTSNDIVDGEEEDQGKKDDDGGNTEAGSDAADP
jgi:hypothetical protein